MPVAPIMLGKPVDSATQVITPTNESSTSLKANGIYHFCVNVNLETAKPLIEWILEENLKPNKKSHLNLIITSYGGDLAAAFAIVDVMRGSSIPVHTTGLGIIASAGLVMFIAGAKGHRILTPNTSILSHQYSWGSYGKEHELFAKTKEFELTSKRMMNHYKKCTGLTDKKIREFLLPSQDIWLSSDEALDLNVCDDIRVLK
jgi:ATP-dependent Clp protease, protease subunit